MQILFQISEIISDCRHYFRFHILIHSLFQISDMIWDTISDLRYYFRNYAYNISDFLYYFRFRTCATFWDVRHSNYHKSLNFLDCYVTLLIIGHVKADNFKELNRPTAKSHHKGIRYVHSQLTSKNNTPQWNDYLTNIKLLSTN